MVSAYLTNLITRRDAISAELAAMDSTKLGGLANVKDRDGGTTVDHVQYRLSLLEELEKINDQIKNAQSVDDAADGGDTVFEFSNIYEG